MAVDQDRGPIDHLAALFRGIGHRSQGADPDGGGGGLLPGGIGQQLTEFLTMPVDLTTLLLERSTEMAELVLATLAEAGYTVVKGTTPL